MKPGDHPEFFRFPAPAGRTRESTIVLDEEGRFWHDGARVDHAPMQRALASWVRRHPDDRRFILSNGYDWTYFEVKDVPFFVQTARVDGDHVRIFLSDGSEENLGAQGLRVSARDALYCLIKDGAFEARFHQQAQLALAPLLTEDKSGEPCLRLNGQLCPIALQSPAP